MKATREMIVEMYRRMVRIRVFEDMAWDGRTEIPGIIHTSVGMEASIVGACMALRESDYMVGTHRSHGHPIGKGASIDRLFAELMGKSTGVNSGKGGSMHLSDFSVGSLGETSIVGSGLPVATGAALGIQMQGLDRVALCFFGDGAAAQGTFHESLNLASIWSLPVVYVCENNAYGELTAFESISSVPNVADRAAGYSMPGETVDGQDVAAVFDVISDSVERAREGSGPSLIETKTYRYYGHSGGPDAGSLYRTDDEVSEWLARDPIARCHSLLVDDLGVEMEVLQKVQDEERGQAAKAWEFALKSPFPDGPAAFDHLFTNPLPNDLRGQVR